MMNTSRPCTHALPLHAMRWVETVALLQRAVLELSLQRDHTCGDIARLLDVPDATVADLLTAGIRDLAPRPALASTGAWT